MKIFNLEILMNKSFTVLKAYLNYVKGYAMVDSLKAEFELLKEPHYNFE